MAEQQSLMTPEAKQRLMSLYENMAKRLGIKQRPKIVLAHNEKNAADPFGKTAYYDHQQRLVKVYVTKRHPTDILRSFAHEIIHHWQNEHGSLPDQKAGGHAHYAQNDPVLRQREMEAYLLGNIIFRDWQDENRYGKINENLGIANDNIVKKKVKQMLFDLIRDRALVSYDRKLTSGRMNPDDFVEELARDIELKINHFLNTVNDRGNWENQPSMIREMSRESLKKLIRSRIKVAMKNS